MSQYAYTPALKAGGNIRPSSFVKFDAANDEQVIQAGAGDTAIGVSEPGTKGAPGTTAAVAYRAEAGDPVFLYTVGAVVEIQVGAVAVVRGFVKSDANGLAIQAATGDHANAFVFESAGAGELVRGMVLQPGTII